MMMIGDDEEEEKEEKEASCYICRRAKLAPYPSTNPMPRPHALCPNPRSCTKSEKEATSIFYHTAA